MNLAISPNRRKAFIINLAGGWISNVFIIVQGLLFIPLYVDILGERQYGFWLATGGVLNWFTMVDVGAAILIQQRVASAYAKLDFQSVIDYLWHGIAVVTMVGIVFTGLVLGLGGLVPELIGVDTSFTSIILGCFYLAAIGTFLYLINILLRAFAEGLQRNLVHSISSILGDVSAIIVIPLGLLVFDIGLWSIALGTLVRQLVQLTGNVLNTAFLVSQIQQDTIWSKKTFLDFRNSSAAIFCSKATGNFALSLPQILLTSLISPETTVLYTVTLKPVQIISAFINRFNSSLFSSFSHFHNDASVSVKRQTGLGRKIAYGFSAVALGSLILYSLLNEAFISVWISSDQFAGSTFTALSALAYYHIMKNNLLGGMGMSTGIVAKVSWILTLESLLKSLLIWIGILLLGLEGVPIALIIAATLFQYPYSVLLQRNSPSVTRHTRLLLWIWLPASVIIYFAAHWGGLLANLIYTA